MPVVCWLPIVFGSRLFEPERLQILFVTPTARLRIFVARDE